MRTLFLVCLPLVAVGWFLGPARGGGGAERRDAVDEPVATISRGEEVALAEHLAPGEWTVIEFGAVW